MAAAQSEMCDPKVLIVVLNWNGCKDTVECLRSLEALTYKNFQVIVVDNGSTDDSVAVIQSKFPRVIILEVGKNLGYAGGNNVGLRYALKHDFAYALLLNNDTVCRPDVLSTLVDAADSHADAAFVAPLIYTADDPTKLWSAGAHWDSDKLMLLLNQKLPVFLGGTNVAEVEVVVGCAILVRIAAVGRFGMLDERFFLVHEESDWCFRARKAGFKCLLVRDAVLFHKVSRSFGGPRSPLMEYFSTRNLMLFASIHLPLNLERKVKFYSLVRILRPIFRRLRWPRGDSPRRIFWGVREQMRDLVSQVRDPMYRARLLGVRDFFFRRFGDCPAAVRAMRQQGGRRGDERNC